MAVTLEHIDEAFIIYGAESGEGMATDLIGTGLRALGYNPTEPEVQEYAVKFDPNAEGFVSAESWRQIATDFGTKPTSTVTDAACKEAFQIFDKDGKGLISTEELVRVMTELGEKLSQEEATAMIKAVDADGNGSVDFTEFVNMLRKGY